MNHLNRRQFLGGLAAGGLLLAQPGGLRGQSNDKLNIGVVGVAGRGGENLVGVAGENIVALCDVDESNLRVAAARFPSAKTYFDFRRLLDQDGIDAVVVSTPDHTHAVAVVAALQSGRHVYCEKPLTRTVSEARRVREVAARSGKVTQIGTQIHAGNNYRRVVELIQRGVVGQVREVEVWVDASYGGVEPPTEFPPVPEGLHYELWLGPVQARPYSPEYVPFKWRHWWAFGGGALADFGCHYMDLPFWALGLKHPRTVEVLDGPEVKPETTPPWLIVKYEFEMGGGRLLPLRWYHGGKQPEQLAPELRAKWRSGVLFVGEQGQLLSNYGEHLLLPRERFADSARPEPFIPNSIGHHLEWIQACKGRGQTSCPFSYSGPLTETALLGNVAFRAGCTLDWDAEKLRAAGCPQAEEYTQHEYRPGWSLSV